MNDEILNFAGDVKIEEIYLSSLASGNRTNITNQVIGIQIFEDIFSPFISGNIVLRESLDLLNNLPITGQEILEFSIRTPTFPEEETITGMFFVYKLTDRDFLAERNVVYKLHFVSFNAFEDAGLRISKTFSGKISDTVETILKSWVGEERIGTIEETKNKTKHTSNFWTPIKNINYLSNQAINQNDSPTYLFFENRGGFNFVSLDSVYKDEDRFKFNYNMKGRDIQSDGTALRNIENDYERINEIIVPDSFDTFGRMRKGVYGSTLYSIDLSTKQTTKREYRYLENFSKKNHLNKFPMTAKNVSKMFDTQNTYMQDIIHFDMYTGFGDTSNNSTLQERLSSLSLAEGFRFTIIVPGRTDYTVGQKAYVKIIQPEPLNKKTDTSESQLDNTFSGSYLIAAINHSISRERHECAIELIRDSSINNAEAQ